MGTGLSDIVLAVILARNCAEIEDMRVEKISNPRSTLLHSLT